MQFVKIIDTFFARGAADQIVIKPMILVKANNNYSNAAVKDSKLSNVFSPPNTVKAFPSITYFL